MSEFRGNKRFKVVERLGQGGMGIVYSVFDQERQVRVALKALRDIETDSLYRFKREFRALQGLSHPNLVSLYELFSDGGQWYYTMELVEGKSFIDYVHYHDVEEEPISGPMGTLGLDDTLTRTTPRGMLSPLGGRPWFNEERLRDALAQLVEGVRALHRAEKVHRDIKPSNVIVTPAGRVVLLDFGLVRDLSGPERSESAIVGTIDYMAPEQASGHGVGPAADLYAIGVVLYEALTGRLPFSGPAMQILVDKQHGEPLPPRDLAAVPDDLDRLCAQLLRRAPSDRPTLEGVLEMLGRRAEALRPAPTSSSGASAFVGREPELERLRAAFEKSRGGEACAVVIEGPSGVGKSALARQFCKQLDGDIAGLVVLAGRYYERETVPYRALDSIMDAVGRFLMRLPVDLAEAFLPLDAPLLAQLFPALRAVEALQQGRLQSPVLDPRELRAKLFRAVRELFIRIGRRRPLVVLVDDFQWADADSLAVFAELLRAPESPSLLFIATQRPQSVDEITNPGLAPVSGVRPSELPFVHERIVLEPLSREDTRRLARYLLGDAAQSLNVAAIADEARGQPLLLDALCRHAVRGGGARSAIRLDDALRARIGELESAPRRVLALCALSPGPLVPEVAARALSIGLPDLMSALATLRIESLIKPTRLRSLDGFETHHDRIRLVALRMLAPADRALYHERLARALESFDNADPEALYHHWSGAGNVENTVLYAARAADRAAVALAFDRAARLYSEAIAFVTDLQRKRELLVKLAETLVDDGRGFEAAQAYNAAVEGAPRAEALELRQRAAEQLLRSGHVDEGIEVLREVLSAVDITLPDSQRGALVALGWRRFRLRVRGRTFTPHEERELAPTELHRIDLCWSMASVLGIVDMIRGHYFQALHLWLALEAGEPHRVGRALGLEATVAAIGGEATRQRTLELLAECRRVIEPLHDPYLAASLHAATGIAAALCGRFREGYQQCRLAEDLFRTRCTGVAWELGTAQFFLNWSLAYLGELGILGERIPATLRSAEDRGDRYAAAAQRGGLPALVWLASDRLDQAEQNLGRGDFMTGRKTGDFYGEHWWRLVAGVNYDLYRRDAAAAHERVTTSWRALERSLLLRVTLTRHEAHHLHARASLALGESDGSRARVLATEARVHARAILDEASERTLGLGFLAAAGAAALLDDRATAEHDLERAIDALERNELTLYAMAARYALASLRPDSEHVAVARAFARKQKIVRPERFFPMLAPGFRAGW